MRLWNWLVTAAACSAFWAPAAQAQAPLSAEFTATDVSPTNRQFYVTGTTTTTATIAARGTVTFNYPVGNPATTRHDVFFNTSARPTECTPALSAGGFVPTAGPQRAPWTASCRFDTPGTYAFTCQIHPTMRASVVVSAADVGEPVVGTVADVLSLTLGASSDLGRFALAVAADYTADMPAIVTSTMANATLTVHDPSTTAPGHLLNGSYVMVQPLQVKATNTATPATTFAPVTSPLALLSWPGPISSDAVTVSFKQPIAATDPLRSGIYAKTLIFTLSSTNP